MKTFSINGSITELEDDRVTIDSSIDSGEFELVWKVDDDDEIEIDELIDTLPQALYIIVEVCNNVECDSAVVPIRLR